MSADRPALLMVSMEPPAGLEDEFHDWYDTEHLPQRVALPGFLSGARWVCTDGWPRWMALYDLASEAAVRTAAYLEVSGAHSTPWSRRILPRTIGRLRITAVGLAGEPRTLQHRTGRLLVMGVPCAESAPPAAIAGAVREALSARAGVVQQRAFVDPDATLWLLIHFDGPVSAGVLAEQIGRPCGVGATTFNLYIPYHRGNQ